MIIVGADNRPPMLDKSLYDSWKSRMEHYMENRENGRMILSSVQNGPLIWPTVTEEDGTTRTKTYDELSVTEKLQADCIYIRTSSGRQGKSYSGTGYKGNATSSGGIIQVDRQSYGSNVLSEAPYSKIYHNDMDNQTMDAMQDFEQTSVVDFSNTEIHSDSNIILVISDKHVVMHVIGDEETLILEEDFGKCFVPQQELLADQAFWFNMSNPTTESSVASPVKVEAPSELPKVSLVNAILKKLKFHLSKFDKVVKINDYT
nr:hypothetical protein [Tanacetum cinerariifolium]